MGCGCKKRNQEEPTQPVPLTIRITEQQTPAPTQPAPVQEQASTDNTNQ
jgi:hypothetical protein